MHLALTHVPVLLSLVGLIMLFISFLLKNAVLVKTSYILLFLAGLIALPVYFSGEGAEEAVEKLPGASEAIIERHEEVAKWSMISIAVAGLLALFAYFMSKQLMVARLLKGTVLAFALLSGGLMMLTAHLGGQIRHSEIRGPLSVQTESVNNEAATTDKPNEEDHD